MTKLTYGSLERIRSSHTLITHSNDHVEQDPRSCFCFCGRVYQRFTSAASYVTKELASAVAKAFFTSSEALDAVDSKKENTSLLPHGKGSDLVTEKVESICLSLSKSRVFYMEKAVEELVSAAFEVQKTMQRALPFAEPLMESNKLIEYETQDQPLIYDKETKKITFSLAGRLVDFDSAMVTACGTVDVLKEHAWSIHNYVVANKACFCAQAQRCQSDIYKRPADSELCRALQFTKTGEVFVHFNRNKQGDKRLASSDQKTLVMAMNIATAQFFVTASFQKADDPEIAFLHSFQGVEGFVQMHHCVRYLKEDRSIKTRVILEHYAGGDLFYKLLHEQVRFQQLELSLTDRVLITGDKKGMTLQDKRQITEDLIRALAFLHGDGCAHCNVKPENIFLFREGTTGVLRAVFGGLRFVYYKDNEEVSGWRGTPLWFSPELAQLVLDGNDEDLSFDGMQKGDVWALGIILCLLFGPFQCLWIEESEMEEREKFLLIVRSPEWPEPSDPNSPVHLAWRMMKKDPKERISAQDALKQLPHLRWS